MTCVFLAYVFAEKIGKIVRLTLAVPEEVARFSCATSLLGHVVLAAVAAAATASAVAVVVVVVARITNNSFSTGVVELFLGCVVATEFPT